MSSILSAAPFHDEAAAFAYVEARVWPKGRACPHCGVIDRSAALQGKTNRVGLYKCYACRKPFTVKIGTIFEDSHIPLHVWLQAMYLMASSKKGISSNQLHRTLGITLKSAWFLSHRVREAMAAPHIDGHGPLGGAGQTIEIDESYVGGKDKNRHASKRKHLHGTLGKAPVFALVERNGRARAFHVPNVNGANLSHVVNRHVAPESTVYSDDNHTTQFAAKRFKTDSVRHAHGEYV
jgi:transposase-like protein